MSHEPFALLFADDAQNTDEGEYSAGFISAVKDDLSDLDERDNIQVLQGSAGYGADATVVVAILTGLSALFLQGKNIEENIDAWLRLGKRLKDMMKRLEDKRGHVRISKPAALTVAVSTLIEKEPAECVVEIIGSHIIPVFNGSIPDEIHGDFKHQPDRFYVFVFRTLSGDAFVVGLRSTGEVEFMQRLPAGNWIEYYGIGDPER